MSVESAMAEVMAKYRAWKALQDATPGNPIPAAPCECPPFGAEVDWKGE